MTHGVGRVLCAAAIAAGLTMTAAGHARAASGVKVGYLQCNVGAGQSMFVTSSRTLDCTFSGFGSSEKYTGEIRLYGVDISYVDKAVLGWAVLAGSFSPNTGELAGEYGGASASVAIGLGVGANVLIGGLNNSITLQPVSLEGIVGGGLSVGVAHLTLAAAH
jgi:hypothetical protein